MGVGGIHLRAAITSSTVRHGLRAQRKMRRSGLAVKSVRAHTDSPSRFHRFRTVSARPANVPAAAASGRQPRFYLIALTYLYCFLLGSHNLVIAGSNIALTNQAPGLWRTTSSRQQTFGINVSVAFQLCLNCSSLSGASMDKIHACHRHDTALHRARPGSATRIATRPGVQRNTVDTSKHGLVCGAMRAENRWAKANNRPFCSMAIQHTYELCDWLITNATKGSATERLVDIRLNRKASSPAFFPFCPTFLHFFLPYTSLQS